MLCGVVMWYSTISARIYTVFAKMLEAICLTIVLLWTFIVVCTAWVLLLQSSFTIWQVWMHSTFPTNFSVFQ